MRLQWARERTVGHGRTERTGELAAAVRVLHERAHVRLAAHAAHRPRHRHAFLERPAALAHRRRVLHENVHAVEMQIKDSDSNNIVNA